MLLVIDVGNTNTTVGVFDGSKLKSHWRLMSERHTADEVGIYLLNLLRAADIDPRSIDGAIMASVVPPLDGAFSEGIDRYLGRTCLKVSTDLDLGIVIGYGAPHEVGADRIVDAVAGVARYGAPLVIADFGTAITLNVIDAKGVYLGGAIAPGLMTSMEALFGRTAKLPKIALEAPSSVIGRTTMESIQAGILYGNAGLVDGLVRRIWDALGRKTTVIATGGLASAVAAHSETIETVDPWLTLEGLRILYERNGVPRS